MIILDLLFDVFENTMSVHLRENQYSLAKHGYPGDWKLQRINSELLDREKIIDLIDQINDYASVNDTDTFIEDQEDTYQVIQLKNYRIVITYPPFSDAYEITIVRPTTQKSLEDYNLHKSLMNRLQDRAEGILIAGAPGHGKSTFASALANHLADQELIIKTIEKPRDLQVDDRITQFTILPEDFEKVADLLLLMRPDYVIFDEIRKNLDFVLYGDLRLAGVGMVGVIHATRPIDAIQRFINRIELGLIPGIIDTVIFINNGTVDTVLSLRMVVKTPYGFKDEALARPVIEVRDFIQGNSMFEIFSFGEQVVVIPTSKKKRGRTPHMGKLSIRKIADELNRSQNVHKIRYQDVELSDNNIFQISAPHKLIDFLFYESPELLYDLENKYKITINLISEDDISNIQGHQIRIKETRSHLLLYVGKYYSGKDVLLKIGPQVIMKCHVQRNGEIKLSRKKVTTKRLEKMIETADEPLSIDEFD
jgi:ATPase